MPLQPGRGVVRLLVVGAVCWGVAALAYGTLRLTFGPRPAYVHVRWGASTDEATRRQLERRYGLSQGEPREERTWGYALTDLSRGNIRALVGDPAVEDTHQIHRTAFRVGYLTPRLPYPTPRAWIPNSLEFLSVLTLLAGALAVGLAALERAAPRAVRGPVSVVRDAFIDPRSTISRVAVRLLRWTRTRIPDASAESAALFRIVFGAALLFIVLRRPVGDAWASGETNALSGPHLLALGLFREYPSLSAWIAPWTAFWGSLFIAGVMARLAFAMTTLGVFGWAILYTTRTTYHTVSALLVALLCLSWSRWSDAWSVDAWMRRPAVRRGLPKDYGYAFWMPGFVLGVVFFAAAVAKLRESGLAWILNGTVKYHFLSDSPQAMVDWGLQLGQHPLVAVALSFAAIAVESLVIVGALSRRYRYRLVAGIAGLSLLSGFVLLQGLFWPGWWILLLSFLPWQLAPGHAATGGDAPQVAASAEGPEWLGSLRPAVSLVVIGVVCAQLIVTLLRLEVSPLLSTYDMYSTTYASPAEYEQKAADSYWVVGVDDLANLHRCRVNRVEADAVTAARSIRESESPAAQVVRRCFDPSVGIRSIAVEGSRARVNWAEWRPEQPARVRLTDPIPVEP